ncbi:MAG: PQQ-like beta-propeller repeat protein [Wolbachia pipientis]|nr:PQQ-like beta-propeller repeat protein [Wolbachia pipientis]
MSLSNYGDNIFFIVNNILYLIDGRSGKIQWEKKLRAPVRGKGVVIHDKLIVLTIDNYLYTFNINDGSLIWAYQNGINEVRGLYSISPVIINNEIVVPFSNGELIAFDESGKKLWDQKLPVSLLDTQFTDITTTPRVLDGVLVVTNSSYVYGIDIKSGNILWSKSLQIKSLSNVVPYYGFSIATKEQKDGGRIFMITKDNKIIGIDIKSGETVWVSNLVKNNNMQLFALIMYANTLWVTSNRGLISIFTFPELKNIRKIIGIPGKAFHAPVFSHNKIYITTEGNGSFSLENRFIFYD